LLNHVVIVVNLSFRKGHMKDRCISNKHSRYLFIIIINYDIR